jgi:hypothetical protein
MRDEVILSDFLDDLLGTYHNQRQAFSYPTLWSFIWVKFELFGDTLKSKSWLNIDGEHKPYRVSSHKISSNNGKITMKNYDGFETEKTCDIIFEREDGYWVGENTKCIISSKNIYISTFVKFNGNEYHSRDAGYDLATSNFLWGKTKEDGEFIFIKQKGVLK